MSKNWKNCFLIKVQILKKYIYMNNINVQLNSCVIEMKTLLFGLWFENRFRINIKRWTDYCIRIEIIYKFNPYFKYTNS